MTDQVPGLNFKQIFILLAVFVGGSLLIYSGVGNHELLNWDDRSYVVNNAWVTNPTATNLVSIFTESRSANWHPLTWLSFIPEYAACGDEAVCYKTTNAVLHGVVSLLVSVLCAVVISLARPDLKNEKVALGGNLALSIPWVSGLIAGLLFLVHPQHVESVTWVAQRKDLLCALFYMAALLAYCLADRSGYLRTYGTCFLFFVLAAMSKSMAVSLPAVLILLDVLVIHPHLIREKRYPELFSIVALEKLPFLAAMLLLMVITMATQSASSYEPIAMQQHLLLIFSGLSHYLLAFLLPLDLSPFYPDSIAALSVGSILLPVLLIAGTMAALWAAIFRQQHYLLALVLAFLMVTIAPVIGIVRIGDHAFADRYSYIPLTGFYAVAGFWVATSIRKFAAPVLSLLPVVMLLLLLGAMSATYKHAWANDVSFWSTVVSLYPDSAAMPLDNLANAWAVAGDYGQAIETYNRSILVDPTQEMAYINLAIVQQFYGEQDSALATLLAGVRANGNSPALLSRAGRLLLERGELRQAEELLDRAMDLRPDLPDIHLSVGLLRKAQGDFGAATDHFERIPANMPQYYEARLQLIDISLNRNPDAAATILDQAIQVFGETPELLSLRERLLAR